MAVNANIKYVPCNFKSILLIMKQSYLSCTKSMKTCESKILTVKYKKNNLKTCETWRKQLIVIYDLFNSHKQIRKIRINRTPQFDLFESIWKIN
jgi:hypothetical protein